jgi:hypothetical protein
MWNGPGNGAVLLFHNAHSAFALPHLTGRAIGFFMCLAHRLSIIIRVKLTTFDDVAFVVQLEPSKELHLVPSAVPDM